MTLKRILVPVDFSSRSAAALRYAIELARLASGQVDALHVVPAPDLVDWALHVYLGTRTDLVSPIAVENAQRALRELVDTLDAHGVAVSVRVVPGDPAAAITRLATEEHHDLIVLCTRGRFGWGEVMREGVARKLLSCAPCPVTVLREGPGELKTER
jgi:nucleotide-binding universal stress UspA family protein